MVKRLRQALTAFPEHSDFLIALRELPTVVLRELCDSSLNRYDALRKIVVVSGPP